MKKDSDFNRGDRSQTCEDSLPLRSFTSGSDSIQDRRSVKNDIAKEDKRPLSVGHWGKLNESATTRCGSCGIIMPRQYGRTICDPCRRWSTSRALIARAAKLLRGERS
jgi:hypothetical protein